MESILKFIRERCNTVKKIIILTIPLVTEEQYYKNPDSYNRTIKYNEILKTIVKESNIYIIDIFMNFETIKNRNIDEFNSLFCEDMIHYNKKGNFILAEILYKKIMEII